ncbi:MAG TPA: ATP-binding cassette domain-containing protein [Solirubrobacteraceae bacterium]|jgi:ABC-type lipoprotein export system ATPase subunit|nr:ATP-binding cassette domain-containing protein [Solirubrobacteraceae bacterium]
MRNLYVEPERPPEALEWPALEFHDVFRIFRSGPVETVALRGLDLRVERAEFVAVLGPSGSGKSTFMALAGALDVPSAGDVRVFGQSLARLGEAELARLRARDLAIVFQSDNLISTLSAHANVALSVELAGVEQPAAAASRALAQFGLAERATHRADSLSGGEQQRVAIAAAAARNASVVLADEPTGELDEANETLVIDALEALRTQYSSAVVVVTHSRVVAERADRVIQLRDGRVAA